MVHFQPGDEVCWESPDPEGIWKGKHGVVIAYVPPGENAIDALVQAGIWARLIGESVSRVERYLVRVQTKRTVHYYTPRASLLRLYRPGGTDDGR